MSSRSQTTDAPQEIALPLKRTKFRYGVANIQSALEALHQDGFVVLKSVLDVEHVSSLNKFMIREAKVLVKNSTKPFNQGVNCAFALMFFSSAVISFKIDCIRQRFEVFFERLWS